MAAALQPALFPLEFHLSGVPRSSQARPTSRARWMEAVSNAARRRAEQTVEQQWLEDEPVAVTIYYFPAAPMAGDIDNIVKPILDALVGTAYLDDQVVERVVAQKFEPEVGWSFESPTEQLSVVLDTVSASYEPPPVVYVRIDNDLSWRRR